MSLMTMDNGLVTNTWEDFNLRPLKDHQNASQSDYKALTINIPGQSEQLYFGSEIEGNLLSLLILRNLQLKNTKLTE